jgi:thiol-disulfide isomerase/thioredoxin
MNRRRWAWAAVALGAAGLGVAWRLRLDSARGAGHASPGDRPAGPPGSGEPASDFWSHVAQRPDGSALALNTLRGAPVLVNFWATWCPPCVREMPLINRFYREFAPQGWRVLGVAIDRRDAVLEYLERQPVAYPIAIAGLEGTNWSRALGNERGGLPFTVAFDAKGRVRRRKLGEISEAELQDWARS